MESNASLEDLKAKAKALGDDQSLGIVLGSQPSPSNSRSPSRMAQSPPSLSPQSSFLDTVSADLDMEYSKYDKKYKRGGKSSQSSVGSSVGLLGHHSSGMSELDGSQTKTRLILKEHANQRQLERLDSLKKAKRVSTLMAEKGKDSLVGITNSNSSTSSSSYASSSSNVISEFNYLISVGEMKTVQKRILKQLSTAKKRQALFEATDGYGMNVLHLAVDFCPQLIKPLVEKGMTLDKQDFRGWNCLSYAAMKGDEGTFALLLSLGAKPDQTCFHYFCSHFCSSNCEQLLVAMLKKGVDLNSPPKNSSTGDRPIHSAVVNARENKVEGLEGASIIVDLLIRYGASVNVTNSRGDTPLHWAVYMGKKKIAKMLCMNGAEINAKGGEGLTALELASRIHTGMESTIRKIHEAISILSVLEFHTEEPREYVLKKFIQEEMGLASFKGINFEILQNMGIKNSANIAVLLSAHEQMKQSGKEETKSKTANEGGGQRGERGVGGGGGGVGTGNSSGETSGGEDSSLPYDTWASLVPMGTSSLNAEIPFATPESRRRLDQRLDKFKLRKVPDFSYDRHCLFSAFSMQLFETEEYYHIRKQASQWLLQNPDWRLAGKPISQLVGIYWDDYCKGVANDIWGDPITLLAIVETFGCEVFVISSIKGTSFTTTLKPSRLLTNKLILLSHLEDMFFAPLSQMVEIPRFWEWNDDFAIDPKDLTLLKKIGEGTTGEIFEGLWKGTKVAAKKIYKHLLTGQEEVAKFRSEVAMLKRFRYQHIVMFLGSVAQEEELIIVTEFVQNSLSQFLRALGPSNLDFPVRIHIAIQIAQGMSYLHGLRPRVLHRDLKANNVLIDSNLNAKICDFGVAKVLEGAQMLQTFVSTVAWTAPEILHGKRYDEKVDIYSFGILLWELLEGKLPYEGMSEQQIILGVSAKGLRPAIPAWCIPPYGDLMKMCWRENAGERPSFEEIVLLLQTLASEFTSNLPEEKEEDKNEEFAAISSPNPSRDETGGGGGGTGSVPSLGRERSAVVTNHFWEIDYDELSYSEKDVIGRGRSAIVYKGFWREQDVAIKVLREIEEASEFGKELEVLAQIRSPHVVFFYGASLSPKNIIVTEFLPAGTLYDLMQRQNANFGWKEVIKYSKDIATGLHFLHAWKPPVIHRDIKSSNLLLDLKGDNVKICDLGLARFTTKTNDATLRRCRGTPAFMAPEIYFASVEQEAVPPEMENPSTKSDIFSLGVVYWELTHRCFYGSYRIPYFSDYKNLQHEAQVLIQVAKKGLRPVIHPSIPQPFVKLITWCWQQIPSQRPSCSEVLERLGHIEKDFLANKQQWNKAYAFNS